jgi:hypothetical protein
MSNRNEFQKELTKLEGLLNSLNNKNKGTKNDRTNQYNFSGGMEKTDFDYSEPGFDSTEAESDFGSNFMGGSDGESRFFKLVSVNGKSVDGGRYELPLKTKSGKPQTRGPKDKASSAFSEICQKNKDKGECSYKFAIQETTRGSDKKVYHYQGKRVKLDKHVTLELKDSKTGEVKKVVKKFKNVITSLGSEHE